MTPRINVPACRRLGSIQSENLENDDNDYYKSDDIYNIAWHNASKLRIYQCGLATGSECSERNFDASADLHHRQCNALKLEY